MCVEHVLEEDRIRPNGPLLLHPCEDQNHIPKNQIEICQTHMTDDPNIIKT